MKADDIDWMPLSPESELILQDVVVSDYNEIAKKYGAELLPSPLRHPRTRFKLLDSMELLMADPIRWRIKGVFPERGIAAIFGPSGSAKSFLALDMACSISRGTPWFSHRTKPCPVVYVCLEGEAGLANRLAAYRSTAPIGRQVNFVTQSIDFLKQKDVSDLVHAIIAYRANGGVVIIDTLNRATPGMDENSSADMGLAVEAAKQIQLAIAGLVVLVHHTGKDATKGMRGHSSLFAALDAAIEVKRNGDVREWCVAKAKDGEDGKSNPFSLDVVELHKDEDGESVSSCVIRATERARGQTIKPLTPSQQMGMDTFFAAAAETIGNHGHGPHAHLNQWRERFYRTSTAETPGGKRSLFNRVRNELVQLEKLVVRDDVYALPAGFSPIASRESDASH